MAAIEKALELYYPDKGEYPNRANYTPGSTAINGAWSTTADGSWQNLLSVLKPYAQNLSTNPPGAADSKPAISGGDNYDYLGISNSNYCGSSKGQMYLLVWHVEGAATMTTIGNCTGSSPLGYYNPTPAGHTGNYRMIK